MNEYELYSGGCVCGAIRYRVLGPPAMVTYCHCDDCRKNSGSIVSVLAGVTWWAIQLRRTAGRETTAADSSRNSLLVECVANRR
jgi:hypothetical protein